MRKTAIAPRSIDCARLVAGDADRRGCVVYALGAPGGIKIGTTKDVQRRIASLQTATATPLELLGLCPGGRQTEGDLHDGFADERIRLSGEWFDARIMPRLRNVFFALGGTFWGVRVTRRGTQAVITSAEVADWREALVRYRGSAAAAELRSERPMRGIVCTDLWSTKGRRSTGRRWMLRVRDFPAGKYITACFDDQEAGLAWARDLRLKMIADPNCANAPSRQAAP